MKKMQNLIPVGAGIVLVGMVIIIFGILFSSEGNSRHSGAKADGNSRIAVGGFIGPIPFGFGNDRQMVYFAIAASFVILALYLGMQYFAARR